MGDGPLPLYPRCLFLRAAGRAATVRVELFFFACLQTWREGASWQASGQRLRGFHRAWNLVSKKDAFEVLYPNVTRAWIRVFSSGPNKLSGFHDVGSGKSFPAQFSANLNDMGFLTLQGQSVGERSSRMTVDRSTQPPNRKATDFTKRHRHQNFRPRLPLDA